jgi:replicative DNA helicase
MPENYITNLMSNIITLKGIKEYGNIIFDLHCKRAIDKLGDDLKQLIKDPELRAKDILSNAEMYISSAYSLDDKKNVNHISKDINIAIQESLNPTFGIRTGINALDNKIMGLKNSCLYIIAARPGMGKTALGLTIALNTALSGKNVLFMSLEMPLIQLQQRILLRVKEYDKLNNLPLYIDDSAGLTISDITAKARSHKRKHKLDVLFIDYLGLIASENKSMNKVHQIEEITTRLKLLSKELNIPVILLSQLSRSVEMRDNKIPMLSDLRDSGSIEQDADVVAFIYREYYYKKNEFGANDKKKNSIFKENNKNLETSIDADIEAIKDDADIIIAKNRHGSSGNIKVKFLADKQWFTNND